MEYDFDVGVSVSGALYMVYIPYRMIIGAGMSFKNIFSMIFGGFLIIFEHPGRSRSRGSFPKGGL